MPPKDSAPDVAEVELKPRRGFSIVWLIPLVAGAIAIWLAYKTISEQGPAFTVSFRTAEGLEAEKTKVKYKDVEVGLVERIRVSEDLATIIVTARLEKTAEKMLAETSRFWVVRPRLGAGGVSGLGTLVSGAYIEIDPGDGASASAFVGLEEAPVVRSDVPGTEYVLTAGRLGSLSAGSPIYFRGIDVGEVLGFDLAEDNGSVTIPIFVRAPYDRLVRDRSRFWNASGFDIELGADGVRVDTESVQAMLIGGLAFDTPPGGTAGPSAAGTVFPLYDSFAATTEAIYVEKVSFVMYFDGSVRGLSVGAPIEFRGIKVGQVRDVSIAFDAAAGEVRIPVTIDIEPQRIALAGSEQDAAAIDRTERRTMISLVERGLRGQLRSGSLLTGQLVVSLDFHPDAPPAKLGLDSDPPEIPTVPSELDEITRSAEALLAKLAGLPLDALIDDLRSTVQATNKLVASPELQQSAVQLNRSLDSLQSLLANVEREVGPLTAGLRRTTTTANDVLRDAGAAFRSADSLVGENAQLRFDLAELLAELTEMARSIRVLADYLEQNPDALLRGKGAPPQ